MTQNSEELSSHISDIHIITAESYSQSYCIAENTHAQYAFVCQNDHQQQQHINLYFVVERNASLCVEICSVAGDVIINIVCVLQGEYARADIRGGHIARGNTKVQVTTQQRHKARYTQSSLLIHSVVDDYAQMQYAGTIYVEREAHNSVSSQYNKNIILSNNARVVSIPNLEVVPHDVQCFHGSSIGRFSAEQYMYAMARGLDEHSIRKLLLHAFFSPVFTHKQIMSMVQRNISI
jgi:Fe-S cluster assembly protein SufD